MSSSIDRLALLDAARMGEADRLTVSSGTAVSTLMARAGAAVAEEIVARFAMRPTVVLCGPGNNGGDGFVLARCLAERRWPVRVALLGAVERMGAAAREHASAWSGSIEPLSPAAIGDAGLVVDALFGAGLNRTLEGQAAATLDAARARHLPIVAVDVPSGLDGDTGENRGAVPAALTVTFFRKKPGHLLYPGRALCGELVVADIGIGAAVLESIGVETFENGPELWSGQLRWPRADDHKYARGHALLVGGFPLTGAIRLAARAALRVGAGLVTVAAPESAWSIYAAESPSVLTRPVSGEADFMALIADARLSAFLIGPGAGVGGQTRARAEALLATGRPVVLDADALGCFAAEPNALARAIRGPCVLTPHEGEFRRVFEVAGARIVRARAAAAACGAVIVLKGADTLIAAPDGRVAINANAPPTLATAGAGDVLAGLLTGLLAQGVPAWPAAAAAVWMHGAAAAAFGPGLIAEDLPELLPAVLRSLSAEHGAGR
ncbi:MAG: NAD(P)H-hydrate dehydratase [Gammaproteobacteria bacterium]|nr:NAD(P)H-hydrate dehydratase [Gammaproteobacteria bacterium]